MENNKINKERLMRYIESKQTERFVEHQYVRDFLTSQNLTTVGDVQDDCVFDLDNGDIVIADSYRCFLNKADKQVDMSIKYRTYMLKKIEEKNATRNYVTHSYATACIPYIKEEISDTLEKIESAEKAGKESLAHAYQRQLGGLSAQLECFMVKAIDTSVNLTETKQMEG